MAFTFKQRNLIPFSCHCFFQDAKNQDFEEGKMEEIAITAQQEETR